MEFNFEIVKEQDITIISVAGGLLEKSQAEVLIGNMDQLILNGNTLFIINFHHLSHLNSTGLNIFISLLTKIRVSGGELVISEIPKKINQLLLITKLNTVFKTAFNNEEAITCIHKHLNKSIIDKTKTE